MAARIALLSPSVDPLSLPPDELRRLGHHVWDRLVDRWEQLDGQPPIAPVDPDFEPARDRRRAPTGPTDPAAGDRRAVRRVPPARPARRPPALLRPHRQPEQPGLRPRRPDRHRAQRVRRQLDGRRGRLGDRARRARLAARVDGDAGRRPRACSSRGGSVGTLTALAAAAHDARRRSRPGHRLPAGAHARGGRQGLAHPRLQPVEPARPARPIPTTGCSPPRSTRRCASTARPAWSRSWSSAPRARRAPARVDPLNDLADLAQREGLWFHVDGAYGAPARLTRAGPTCWPASSAPTASCWTRTSGSSSRTRSAPSSSATPGLLAAHVHARRRLPARHEGRRRGVPRARTAAHPRLARAEALSLAAGLRPRRLQGGDRPRHRAGRVRRGAAATRTPGGRSSRPRTLP